MDRLKYSLVDSHCHLHLSEFAEDIDDVMERMAENAVRYALDVGITIEDNPLPLIHSYKNLAATVGVHPLHTDAEISEGILVDYLDKMTQNPAVVGIGETGLDYYRCSDQKQRDRQIELLAIQANYALRADLPLVIHMRDAEQNMIDILRDRFVPCVMHCFTGSIDAMRKLTELGCYIGVSGIVTFKNADIEMYSNIPLDKLLLETDCPYLSPAPYRGKRNDPSMVLHTARKMAELKGISLEEIAEITTRNFFNLFKKASRYFEISS